MDSQEYNNNIHNCHIHTFTKECVPVNFLPFGLVRLLLSRRSIRLAKFLNNIFHRADADVLARYINFFRLTNCHSQSAILEYLSKFYPQNTKFILLSMDMSYLHACKVPMDFNKH